MGGLRRGELQALRAENVDLASGVIRVEHGWDDREGQIALKSRAGRRRVPITGVLRDLLLEHRLRVEREGPELLFGRSGTLPFYAKGLQARADKAWEDLDASEHEAAEREKRDPELLTRITLHECRHTFASLMIAAGVNAKALQTFMGHASVSVTLDRYGHLMPGSEAEAAQLLDAYLATERERAEDAAREAEASSAILAES